MDRNLGMDLVRVTEAAALGSSRHMGRGDDVAADKAAIVAMRNAFTSIAIDGTVVIGEGPEDAISMLYVGEKVGTGQGPQTDVALDAIEGPATCATGGYNALAIIAVADAGTLLRVPDTYMDKIACGPEGRGVVDLGRSPTENLRALAEAKRMYPEDLTVVVLDRPRHLKLIEEIRAAGARIKLISDGDVSAALATTQPETGIDIMMGIGRAPQGILAAAALKCLDGEMQAKLRPRNETEAGELRALGLYEFGKIHRLDELVRGNVVFAATGVTPGDYLNGVRYMRGGAVTNSVVMRSQSKTIRLLQAHHRFDRWPDYGVERP
jgi:fructose-1,6-bisphosphatase class II